MHSRHVRAASEGWILRPPSTPPGEFPRMSVVEKLSGRAVSSENVPQGRPSLSSFPAETWTMRILVCASWTRKTPGLMRLYVVNETPARDAIDQDLDGAILDRMDEVLHLPRPTWAERLRLAHQYFKVYFGHEMSAAGATFPSSCDGDAACHGSINGSAALTVSSPEDCVTGEVAVSATSTLCQAATCPEFLPGAARPFGLTGATSASSPVARGTREMVGRRRLGGARSIGLSPGVRAGVGRLIQRTAIVTEGFYGRDMSRLFSALQVSTTIVMRNRRASRAWEVRVCRVNHERTRRLSRRSWLTTSS